MEDNYWDLVRELRIIAFKFRDELLAEMEHDLSLCKNDDEKLDWLQDLSCRYWAQINNLRKWQGDETTSPDQQSVWVIHQNDTFQDFCTWYLQVGGTPSDFQGILFEDWAKGWALNKALEISGEKTAEICNKNIEEQERSLLQSKLADSHGFKVKKPDHEPLLPVFQYWGFEFIPNDPIIHNTIIDVALSLPRYMSQF